MKKLELIESRLPKIKSLANPCRLCLHECKVNRQKNKKGFCRSGLKPCVYSFSPHNGEEPPLSGTRGSGTIFFTHCNLKCLYCHNYTFSQESDIEEIEIEELSNIMLELERLGCHNINFVSPTHYTWQIIEALKIATEKGLKIPIVYNTGGYDNPELIKLLDGIVDIYLPDMRYSKNDFAKEYSSAPKYVETNRAIVKEMFRQVGVLEINKEGIAKKGVIVRLLILPNGVSNTIDTLKFLKKEVSSDIYLSVMSQYHPTYKALNYPKIARRITQAEYQEVVDEVERLGFKNGWIQGYMYEPDHFLGTNIRPKST